MSLTAIITCHMETPTSMLCNLASQTREPTEVMVGASKLPAIFRIPPMPFSVDMFFGPDEGDYGYGKRNRLLQLARSEWVGFFNHDDSYHETFIDQMLAQGENTDADVVYCPWSGIPRCTFRPQSSTLGNWIARTSLLKRLGGFPLHPKGHAWRDAGMIELLNREAKAIVKCPDLLYFHNKPFLPGTRTTRFGEVI
jgi:hypothetical protein